MDVSKIGAVWHDGHAERNDVVEEVDSCKEEERQSLKKYLPPETSPSRRRILQHHSVCKRRQSRIETYPAWFPGKPSL